MKVSVINLTNSPFDLEGGIRLPAMGRAVGDFSDEYLAALRVSPGVIVEKPLERPSLDKRALLEGLDDEGLADVYEKAEGKKPHHKMKRETIIERLLASAG
jgi:hypothetical protein